MERSEISDTLGQIEGLRLETRRNLQAFWFPMILFGGLTLLGGLFCTGDHQAVGLFWAVAGPAGGVATGVRYARRETSLGLCGPAAPYIVVAVGLMAGAFLLPAVTSGDLQEVVSYFAVAVGYLGFAWIEREWRIAAVAALLAAVPLVMLAIAPEAACAVTAAVVGAVLLASGLAFRRTQAGPAIVRG